MILYMNTVVENYLLNTLKQIKEDMGDDSHDLCTIEMLAHEVPGSWMISREKFFGLNVEFI